MVVILTLLAALLLSLALASRADALIYWSTAEWPTGAGISRADLDGTEVDSSFLLLLGLTGPGPFPGSILDVAVDKDRIYWTDQERISRANIDGTGVERGFITSLEDTLIDLAVDSDHIYWTWMATGPSYGIGRANLDGSGVDRRFITAPDYVGGSFESGLAVDDDYIYWTGIGSRIGRANIDGSGVENAFIELPPPPMVDEYGEGCWGEAIAVDASYLYWGTGCFWLDARPIVASTIARANLDGTGGDRGFISFPFDPFGSAPAPHSIAVNASHIYWSQAILPGSISRANLDGTGLSQLVESDNPIGDLAIDSRTFPDAAVDGSASAKKKQKQKGKKIVVKVKVKASEDLEAKGSGKVKVKKKSYKLKPETKSVDEGRTKTLKLEPKKKQAEKKIVKALKQGRTAKAKLTMKLSDGAGNTESQKLSVTLQR